MDIPKIQRQTASTVDELLAVSEDISNYIIPAYGTAPRETFDMQCRVQLERCRRLKKKLKELDAAVSAVAGTAGTGSGAMQNAAAPLSVEQQRSLAVTGRMIVQNLAILNQKQELLENFLSHSERIQESLDNARELETQAEILRLKSTLRKELRLCQAEKEE